MSAYRKKPVVIEAVPVREVVRAAAHDWKALPSWVVDAYEGRTEGVKTIVFRPEGIDISTLEGVMFGALDDWLIRGVKGELYPCKPDIFDATYEPA